MQLFSPRYGKQKVRVLKVTRDGSRHSVTEIMAEVLLEGGFESAYLSDDNSQVVPTDTVKNTIQALAKDHLRESLEEFALFLGRHFLEKYSQISAVNIELVERVWERMETEGKAHPHTFLGRGPERPFTRVRATPEGSSVQSGIRDLLIMKTTESGFVGYPKCEFTTLPETNDRILATSLEATWTYASEPAAYRETNRKILDSMLKVFASNFSPSAQRTLFEMAEAALTAVPEIKQIELKLPNKHYLLVNLSPFGMENANEVFMPTDEPHGEIEASVRRR